MTEAVDDMSTKPDESSLFLSDFKPEEPTVDDFPNEPSNLVETDIGSPSMSETIIFKEDLPFSVPKAEVSPFSKKNGTLSSLDEPVDTPGASPSGEPTKKAVITLYFLPSSRSIRIAWLLEELGLEYNLVSFDREEDMSTPGAFREACGASMGKAPVLKDGNLVLEESGAITQYLLDKYDTLDYLLPHKPSRQRRAKVLTYIHAAEGTFLLHGLVPFYVNRADYSFTTDHFQVLTADTGNDLDWLDAQIKENGGRFLVGDTITAADTMMGFSVQFILEFGLHPKEKEGQWDNVRKWLENVKASKTYQRAVKKTAYALRPE